jgi:predicted 2-oxoglutarate/Fe(II)-dependent dioxygenase YbiX
MGTPDLLESTAANVAPRDRNIMPPYVVLRDFLDDRLVGELLDLAISREADFRAGRIVGSIVKPAARKAWTMGDLKEFGPLMRAKIRDRLPEIVAALQVTPVVRPNVALELVAYRDGDFFKRHVDTLARMQLSDTLDPLEERLIVVLSGVYYFRTQPKGFTGGELRLYAFGDPRSASFVDVEPAHNSLIVFPSWSSHEVLPVRCRSGRFEDARFSVNYFIREERRPLRGGAGE